MTYPTPEVPTEYPVKMGGTDTSGDPKFDTIPPMDAFDDCDSVETLLYQLAGAASMCWVPRPGDQVFNSELAQGFVELALARLRQLQ